MLFEIFRLSIPDLQPGNSISLATVQDEQLTVPDDLLTFNFRLLAICFIDSSRLFQFQFVRSEVTCLA